MAFASVVFELPKVATFAVVFWFISSFHLLRKGGTGSDDVFLSVCGLLGGF